MYKCAVIFLLPAFILLTQTINVQSISTPIIKKNITIGVVLDFQSKDRYGYQRAVELAKECIVNNTGLKYFNDRYELMLNVKNDFNFDAFAIKYALEISETSPKPLAFLGLTTSSRVEYVAATLDYNKYLIVTVISDYKDENVNKNILSSSSGMDQEVKGRIEFLKTFKWKRVGFVYSLWKSHALSYVDKMLDAFKSPLYPIVLTGSAGIEVRKSQLHRGTEVLRSKLIQLKQNDTKIFIAEIQPYEALVFFCEVHKLKMYGDDIVWILSSITQQLEQWMAFNNTRKGQVVSCTEEQMRETISGVWVFDRQVIREDNVKTASGLTSNEYLDKLVEMRNRKGEKQNTDRQQLEKSSLAFDGLWAIVTAINNTIEFLSEQNITLSMDDKIRGERTKLQKTLFNKMKTVDFEGIAGPYSYSSDFLTKDGTVKLMHYQEGKRLVKVGEFHTKTSNLTFLNDTKYLWGPGGIPKDRSTIIDEVLQVNRGMYIAMTTLASIGIFLGIMFLTFNLVYGKYKFIKLSAPLFNNIIACGCLLCLVSVFLFGIHDISNPAKNFALICKARAWMLSLGFSCAFGAMFVKTWRIYKICTNKKLRVKLGPLSNWYLLSLIGGIVFIDLIILVTWEAVDPLKHGQHVITAKKRYPNTRFKYIREVLNVCQAQNMVVWLTVIYVYKGVLILYGLFLAYETRNVIYAHLNDSRVIGICVYNVVVLSVVGAFLSLLLDNKNYEEMYIVLSVCITFPAVATICLMMFPKIAYRCKTDNLDDTETIGNGMTTVGHSFDVSTVHTPQIHVTKPAPLEPSPIEPSSSPKDAKFSYHKDVSDSVSNGISELSVQNGDVKQ